MSSYKDNVTPSAASERLTGRVKWFNNKTGYGFITITDGERSGSDIFVHHSTIGVSNQQYKYLVQGEYVDFDLVSTQGGAHEFQATNVVGIKGGKLMCETRHEFKVARSNYKTTQVLEPVTVTRQQRVPNSNVATESKSTVRARGEGPRDSAKKEWTVVKGRQPNAETSSKKFSRTTSS
jgi:cold shock CspA family protein